MVLLQYLNSEKMFLNHISISFLLYNIFVFADLDLFSYDLIFNCLIKNFICCTIKNILFCIKNEVPTLFGMLKLLKNKDTRKGLAFMLNLTKGIGKQM